MSKTTIRGIFIDAAKKEVREIDLPHESRESDWRWIRDRLECQYIDRAPYDRNETLWIDDEGLLVQPNPHGYFQIMLPHLGRVGIFAGHGLILGTTPSGFDTDSRLDIEEVRANVRFLGIEDLGPDQLEPKHVLTSWDTDGNESRQEFSVPVAKKS